MFTQREKDAAVGRYTKSTDPEQVARWREDGDKTDAVSVGILVRNCDYEQYERVLEYVYEDLLADSIASHEIAIAEQE